MLMEKSDAERSSLSSSLLSDSPLQLPSNLYHHKLDYSARRQKENLENEEDAAQVEEAEEEDMLSQLADRNMAATNTNSITTATTPSALSAQSFYLSVPEDGDIIHSSSGSSSRKSHKSRKRGANRKHISMGSHATTTTTTSSEQLQQDKHGLHYHNHHGNHNLQVNQRKNNNHHNQNNINGMPEMRNEINDHRQSSTSSSSLPTNLNYRTLSRDAEHERDEDEDYLNNEMSNYISGSSKFQSSPSQTSETASSSSKGEVLQQPKAPTSKYYALSLARPGSSYHHVTASSSQKTSSMNPLAGSSDLLQNQLGAGGVNAAGILPLFFTAALTSSKPSNNLLYSGESPGLLIGVPLTIGITLGMLVALLLVINCFKRRLAHHHSHHNLNSLPDFNTLHPGEGNEDNFLLVPPGPRLLAHPLSSLVGGSDRGCGKRRGGSRSAGNLSDKYELVSQTEPSVLAHIRGDNILRHKDEPRPKTTHCEIHIEENHLMQLIPESDEDSDGGGSESEDEFNERRQRKPRKKSTYTLIVGHHHHGGKSCGSERHESTSCECIELREMSPDKKSSLLGGMGWVETPPSKSDSTTGTTSACGGAAHHSQHHHRHHGISHCANDHQCTSWKGNSMEKPLGSDDSLDDALDGVVVHDGSPRSMHALNDDDAVAGNRRNRTTGSLPPCCSTTSHSRGNCSGNDTITSQPTTANSSGATTNAGASLSTNDMNGNSSALSQSPLSTTTTGTSSPRTHSPYSSSNAAHQQQALPYYSPVAATLWGGCGCPNCVYCYPKVGQESEVDLLFSTPLISPPPKPVSSVQPSHHSGASGRCSIHG